MGVKGKEYRAVGVKGNEYNAAGVKGLRGTSKGLWGLLCLARASGTRSVSAAVDPRGLGP